MQTSSMCSTTGGWAKNGPDNAAPFGKGGRLAKAHGVVFQGVPVNGQDVAALGLDAAVDLEALKALGLGDHGACTAFDGFFEGGGLGGIDADVGVFQNHVG